MNLSRHLPVFSWAVAARILPIIYGIALLLAVMPSLAPEEFGRYSIVFSMFLVIILLNKSLVLNPMIRFAAEPGQFGRMIRAGFVLNCIIYIIIGIGVWVLSPIAAGMYRIETADIRIVPALLAVFLLRDFCYCLQQTIFRTRTIFFIDAVYYIGSAGGFVFLLMTDSLSTAKQALEVNLIAGIASSIVAMALGFGGARLLGGFEVASMRKIVHYGYYTVGIGLANALIYEADKQVIGIIYTPVEVGIYSGAKIVWKVFSSVNQAVGMLILPYASRLAATKNTHELKALLEKAVAYCWFGLAGLAVVCGIAASQVYSFFLGDVYNASIPLLLIMLVAAPFEGVFNVAGSILYGIGEARKVAKVSLGVLAVLVFALFPGAYLFGGPGAASAMALALIISGLWMFRTAAKELDSGFKPTLTRLAGNVKSIFQKIRSL